MVTHDELLAELFRQIDAGKFTQAKVAARLCIAPARITEMKRGSRRIQQHEMPILAEMLGLSPRSPGNGQPVIATHKIPHLGKVAQGLWLEQSITDPDQEDYISYDRVAGDPGAEDLFAVTPEGLSMNLLFPPGMKLICQRVPFSVGKFRDGDLVIVSRTNHDLREMTCKRLIVDQDGTYWLRSESDQPQFQEPWRIGRPSNDHHVDTEIEIIGKVLRGVVDYSTH